jgi:drug/metabolite transporter (DMT)-like permease
LTTDTHHDRIRGMTAMLIGVACFAFMDAGLKLLAGHYPPAQAAAMRGLAATPVVLAWALLAGGARQLVRVRWGLHVIRGALSVIMMVAFTYGISTLALSKAYAIFFVAPLLIAIACRLFLDERVVRAQWIAIVVGFAGVLIVLRPGSSGYGWAGTLAVFVAAVCYALSSVLVKIVGRTDTTQSMMVSMTAMMALGTTLLALPDWQPIQERHHLVILGIAITGAIGQWGITDAFRRAPSASVAPLEYSGLAWVIGIDLLAWNLLPEWQTLAGAAVIIVSGIYLLRFEARRAAHPAPSKPNSVESARS